MQYLSLFQSKHFGYQTLRNEWNEAHPLQRRVQSGMVLHNNSATRVRGIKNDEIWDRKVWRSESSSFFFLRIL